MDREELIALVDQKVAVRLKNVEAGGVEIIATLDGVRANGIVLREVGELGPGPTVFCPWEALHRVRWRPSWLYPPQEESELEERVPEGPRSEESYYLRAPVAQKRAVGDVTVAVSSLERHGQGAGVLRWRISMGKEALSAEPDFWFGTPEPEFEILADGDRSLKRSPMRGGMSNGDSDGEAEVWEMPETGELRVTVTRLSAEAYGPAGDHLGEGASMDGPWSFRFAL